MRIGSGAKWVDHHTPANAVQSLRRCRIDPGVLSVAGESRGLAADAVGPKAGQESDAREPIKE